jgi:PAS domain S-box-containing protein
MGIPAAARPVRILLVEDNPADIRMVRELLGETCLAGSPVEVAPTAAEAVERLSTAPFDVVLLDLFLPDARGLEAFARAHAAAPDVAAIVLSGLDDEQSAARAVLGGAQDYLLKARLDPDVLVRSIRYGIERNAMVVQLREALLRKQEAAKAQLQSEARLRSLISNVPGAVYEACLAPERRFLFLSERIDEITGYGPQEFLTGARSWASVLHPQDALVLVRALRRAAEHAEAYEVEYRVVHRDGGVRWVSDRGAPLPADGRGPVLVEGLLCDVTDRRTSQEDRARLAAIVESSDDAIMGQTLEGTITSWNLGAQRLYGWLSAEILGRPSSALVPPDRPDELPEILGMIGRGERLDNFETVRLCKDGREIHVSLTVSPVSEGTGDGPVTGASVITRDITQRKQVERALREAQARMNSAFRHALIGIALVDLHGRFLQVNPAMCEITGYSEQELLATTVGSITHAGDRHAEQDYFEQMVAGKIPSYRIEKRYRHAEGRVFWALTGVSVAMDYDRRPLHLIWQMEDITDRKRPTGHVGDVT